MTILPEGFKWGKGKERKKTASLTSEYDYSEEMWCCEAPAIPPSKQGVYHKCASHPLLRVVVRLRSMAEL